MHPNKTGQKKVELGWVIAGQPSQYVFDLGLELNLSDFGQVTSSCDCVDASQLR
jgi:hypothetical protein